MWHSMHFDVRVVGANPAGSWKVERAGSSGAGSGGSCLWDSLDGGNTSSTLMMPRMTATLSVVLEPKIAVVASLKISSVHVVGVCWKVLVTWGWKFLLAVLGLGVFGRGRLADFFGRDRPAGFFTVAFGMMRWLGGEGEGLGKKGKILIR